MSTTSTSPRCAVSSVRTDKTRTPASASVGASGACYYGGGRSHSRCCAANGRRLDNLPMVSQRGWLDTA